MKKRVLVLFGGNSFEHLISCKSAKSILENIDTDKYEPIPVVISKDNKWYLYEGEYLLLEKWEEQKITKIENIILFLKNIDVVFPIIHGNTGEDGMLQGLFELFNIKYVGSDILTSSICYDKEYTKIILDKYNIPVVPFKVINKSNYREYINYNYEYPVIVKPCSSGSSLGVDIANNILELNSKINAAFKYSDKVITEKFIKARELECAVLVERDNVYTSVVGEIEYNGKFYDYDSKYVNESKLIIPSSINKDISDMIKKYAHDVALILNIKSLARIDFLYDEVNNKIYLMEINSLPGFTTISMYPKLFNYEGISYKDLITRLIESAF